MARKDIYAGERAVPGTGPEPEFVIQTERQKRLAFLASRGIDPLNANKERLLQAYEKELIASRPWASDAPKRAAFMDYARSALKGIGTLDVMSEPFRAAMTKCGLPIMSLALLRQIPDDDG
jgi:hypothetical protein